MLVEGRIETINFQENFDLQVTLVSTPALEAERFTFRCKCTAGERRLVSTGSTQASTNGLPLKQTVRWLENPE